MISYAIIVFESRKEMGRAVCTCTREEDAREIMYNLSESGKYEQIVIHKEEKSNSVITTFPMAIWIK